MAIRIADTATVDPGAELADGVEIGPYCVVGPEVSIGRTTRLTAHVCLIGRVRIGERNSLGPFSVLGAHSSINDRKGEIEIGDENTIREGASIESGSESGGTTQIGSRNLIGPHAVVSQSSILGDEVNLGPSVRIGTMARIEAFAVISSGVEVHPFVTIGEHGYARGPGQISRDLPRFLMVDGAPPRVRGINLIGLKGRGFDRGSIRSLREAHRLIFRAGLDLTATANYLVDHGHMTSEVIRLLESLHAQRSGRHGRAREGMSRSSEFTGAATDQR